MGSGHELDRLKRRIAELEQARIAAESANRKLRAELAASRKRAARYERRVATLREQKKEHQWHLRRTVGALRNEASKGAHHRYGSYTPGVAEWERKWAQSPGRRVLFYAPTDHAGSFFRWAAALNRHSSYAVRVACLNPHPFGYDLDLLFPDPELLESELANLVAEADIVHVSDEEGVTAANLGGAAELVRSAGKPIVFTHYGGRARLRAADPAYRRTVLGFAARVATTPDLCFPWFEGRYVPLAIDAEAFPYDWTDGRGIAHSPSIPARKGTEDFLAALEGLECEVDLIHGVGHSECLARKRRCNLFFDQAGLELPELGGGYPIGWYANSALEAAVHGIPTVAHLSDEALERAARAGKDVRGQCAIINTQLGEEGIRATFARLLAAPPPERAERSRATRAWIERFHSYPAVARDLAAVYDSLSTGPAPASTSARSASSSRLRVA